MPRSTIKTARKVQAGWYTYSYGPTDICGFQNSHVDFVKGATWRGIPSWNVTLRDGVTRCEWDPVVGRFNSWDDADRFARAFAAYMNEDREDRPDPDAPQYRQYDAREQAKFQATMAKADAWIADLQARLNLTASA